MNTIKIIHIIQGFYSGGSGRALIATAKNSLRLGNFQHRVVSLAPASLGAIEMAEEAGLSVLNVPDRNTLLLEIENADIVHLHFWNNPQMYEFLRSELPAMRLLIWFHVAGHKPPQILTQELVDLSDFALACSPYTYEHQVFQNLPAEVRLKKTGMVYGAADFERVSDVQLRPHDTFNVGYIGHISFAKMHPNYVPMSAGINIPNVRFIVCGGGINDYLYQQAQQLGSSERFEFRGYVEDIKSVIEILDVYGYPLCEDTYAAAELNLQEAMYAGVPPVVFSYGGVKRLVIDNYTGLVVQSELEYKQAIEYLYHHPEERTRLSRNAREYAQQIFGAENAAKRLNPIYERLMELPKREREWGMLSSVSLLDQPVSLQDLTGEPEELSGAQAFIQSLGDTAPQFTVSLTSPNIEELFEADRQIAASSTLLAMGEGGLIQYQTYYPNDGYLRLWSGLVKQRRGQPAEAIAEFTRAVNLGCNHWRVCWYIAQIAEKINDISLAQQALGTISQAVPDFAPAQEMLQRLEAALDRSTDLIDSLRLRELNYIIFPNWSVSEDILTQELTRVIRAIASHPAQSKIALLIYSNGISEEDANLLLSGIAMNLFMQEELDVEDLEISLVEALETNQWKTLVPHLQARISLEHENQEASTLAKAANLPSCELDSLSEIRSFR
jgi:glycosyltransferase involved in cell wall biosynthesis/tetratricopeptide (TPR) repeat protein